MTDGMCAYNKNKRYWMSLCDILDNQGRGKLY